MSTHTIMDFKAQMLTGFARPNLFKVKISKVKTSEQLKYEMSCYQAQIPGHNIATTDKDIGFRSIAYQKIFSDVILGFYVDSNLSQLKFFQEWIDQIVYQKNPNIHNYYNSYVGKIEITQENRFGQKVATWTLHDAYPKQVDPIQLDYGTNDAIMTCNATITYRHFTVEQHELVKSGDGQLQPDTYAHSSNTELNKIDQLIEVQTQRWKYAGGNEMDSGQVSEKVFRTMYPTYDDMDRAEQQAARKLYGFSTSHGDSMVGGAGHHLTT